MTRLCSVGWLWEMSWVPLTLHAKW
jgi:hypothetical protein